MKLIKFMILALSLSCSTMAGHEPLDTVEKVELNKYLGKWYEIARFEQSFQKGCEAVTAEYSLRKDGDINVLNSCREGSVTGPKKQSTGRAWIKDKKTNAKLKVQFFLKSIKIGFLSGNYWIIDLGENYEYTVIGDPSRKYLWFLSRTPKMEESLFNELVARAREKGFETEKLRITKQ